jgi:hypothetical protein
MHRRAFITGLFCAPAIVHIQNIMPVKVALGEGDLISLLASEAFQPDYLVALRQGFREFKEMYAAHVFNYPQWPTLWERG